MRLNVKKSAGYDIKPCASRSYLNNDVHPKWEVDGQELPLIAPADGTKYLGVKVNSWTGVTKENTGEKLELWCLRIDKAPPQAQAKVGNAKPVCNREATILFVPSRNPSM